MLSFAFNFGYYLGYNQIGLTPTVTSNYITVKIYPLFYQQMVLEWSVPPEFGNCEFDVYKAQSDIGPWTKLTATPVIGNIFKDTTNQDYSKFDQGFYIVECRLEDGRRIQSPVASWEDKRTTFVEIRAQEVKRRETLLLQKFTGKSSLVFRRKTFGKRCSNCWNYQIEKVTQDHCRTCFGTSFEGGYFPGYETLIQYEPTPNNAINSPVGRLEPNQIPAWTTDSPRINNFDLVLRLSDFKMYRVDQIQNTELQTIVVRQILSLNELDKESIEFKLALQAIPLEYQT